MIQYPNIDPVIFNIGPFAVRWYGLAYVIGILLGIKYAQYISKRFKLSISSEDLDDYLIWLSLGILLGGRIGYVIFYDSNHLLHDPMYLFRFNDGLMSLRGMSFHGGLIGVILATYLFCWRHKKSFLELSDMAACVTPIGLFLGRIANFINAELWGRPTDVPWAIIFPGHLVARHPSQIYEALTEGVLLFVLINILLYTTNFIYKPGRMSAIFLLLYASFRSFCEMYREPDAHIGFLIFDLTMGQILSSFMVFVAILVLYVNRNSIKNS